MMKTFLIFFSVLLYGSLSAQTSTEFEIKYNNAKSLIQNKEFELAYNTLKPLVGKESFDNAREVYFLYSLCAFKLKSLGESDLFLSDLIKKYPSWSQINEAKYLHGLVYFAKGEESKAYLSFESINADERMKTDIKNAKLHHLDSLPTDRLEIILSEWSKDKETALVLARRYNRSFAQEDRKSLDSLVKIYGFDKNDLGPGIPEKLRTKKNQYNVMVLLPLSFGDMEQALANKSAKYFYDFYNGLTLGLDSLNKKGNKIKLHVFDVERDTSKLQMVLNSPQAAQMDMIIGPIVTNLSLPASEFAEKNEIVMVNPVNNHPDITKDKIYVLGTVPTNQTIANFTAGFAKSYYKTDTSIIVYYYTDTVFKDYYEAAIEKEEMFNLKSAKVYRYNASSLVDTLNTLKIDSLKHIFVPTNDQIISANLMGALDLIGHEIQVFAPSGWLSIGINDFAQYERKNINFFDPEYVDFEDDEVKWFKQKYFSQFNVVPSHSSYLGYDLMLFFGKELIKNGPDFHLKLREQGFKPGIVLGGYDYTNASDNQYFPIIKFVRARVSVLNKP